MAVNVSEVRLLSVPLQSDYKNTAYFTSASAQASYFAGKAKLSTTNVSYIKDNVFTYPADYDDLQEVNYVMYKNTAYTNKWFYAFITDKERLNDGATRVHIKTDSIQTYLFDYEAGFCFVEREHVTDDTAGAHTIPEGLETGEYICDGKVENSDLSANSIVVGATLDLNDYKFGNASDWNLTKEYKPMYGDTYGGLYSGLTYIVMTPAKLKETLKNVAYEGQEDAIHTIFMAPGNFLDLGTAGEYGTPLASGSLIVKPWSCATKPTSINGYTPKNKKLLTSPYCYLMVDNGGGTAVTYHYEKFQNDNIEFQVNGTVTPGMSIRAIPKAYNGISGLNHAEGINLAKYAQCSWTTDAFTAWFAKNGVSTVTSIGAGAIALKAAGAGATAGAAGGVPGMAVGAAVAGAVAIIGGLSQVTQHAEQPPQLSGNTNGGDVATASQQVTFTAYKMAIKKEYAQIIDNFFTMYGYKVNSFKVPNKNHRQYFWYTKTIDAVITGDIPQEDLQTIKNCYDKGITFWKNPDNIGMTVTSNAIV